VAERLRMRLPTPDLLTSEQRYGDPLGYQCHVLHAESDGSFSIVAVVWRPGQATAHEERYALRNDGWLELAGSSVSSVGEVTSLVPPGDIHLVRNAGSLTTISLHIYGTDLSRLGSSVRRTYNLPVVAGHST